MDARATRGARSVEAVAGPPRTSLEVSGPDDPAQRRAADATDVDRPHHRRERLPGRAQPGLRRRHRRHPGAGGLLLGDVVGGYGVAQACLGVAAAWDWDVRETTVAIQGIGTMGGGAAGYLHEAGMKVVAVADAAGTLYDPAGLDVPALLELRDRFGEVDRSRLPAGVRSLPRETVVGVDADIFVPAAISYALRPDNENLVKAAVVVEAANAATTPEAEAALSARGVAVVPDFVANAGAATWAWWLLLGEVGADPADSFLRVRTEMQAKVALLLTEWNMDRLPQRVAGQRLAETTRARRAEAALAPEGEPALLIP